MAGATSEGRGHPAATRRLVRQFARFLAVGAVAFAIDYGVFLLLHAVLDAPYVLASAISLALSLVVSYMLTVRYVFAARPGRNVGLELALYVAISVVAIGINQGVLLASVELLQLAPEVGKLVATAVVLVFNFVARKALIERRHVGHAGKASPAG